MFDPKTGLLTLNSEQAVGIANLCMLGYMVCDSSVPPQNLAEASTAIGSKLVMYKDLMSELMPSFDAAFTHLTGLDPLGDRTLDN